MIRLTRPSIEDDDLEAVCGVLRNGQLVQGPQVAAFEDAVRQVVGTKHAIAVSNCTAALQMALLSLGVGAGDLVLVSAYSWPSTGNVVELCGAQPVFVDVDERTGNLTAETLGQALATVCKSASELERLKAIMPVHAFGQLPDMASICAVAASHRIPIIEDAACALGARADATAAGAWGDMGCFSFHPRKAITTGEGGVITTNSDAHAARLRTLRNHGQDITSLSGDPFILPGFNNRMTDFQGALGVTQMQKLERILKARHSLARRYDALLSPELERTWTGELGAAAHTFQSFVVRLPLDRSAERALVIDSLKRAGVEAQIGTWHLPMTTYFRTRYGYSTGHFPGTDSIARRALTLPLYEGMTSDDVRTVVNALHSTLGLTTREENIDA